MTKTVVMLLMLAAALPAQLRVRPVPAQSEASRVAPGQFATQAFWVDATAQFCVASTSEVEVSVLGPDGRSTPAFPSGEGPTVCPEAEAPTRSYLLAPEAAAYGEHKVAITNRSGEEAVVVTVLVCPQCKTAMGVAMTKASYGPGEVLLLVGMLTDGIIQGNVDLTVANRDDTSGNRIRLTASPTDGVFGARLGALPPGEYVVVAVARGTVPGPFRRQASAIFTVNP